VFRIAKRTETLRRHYGKQILGAMRRRFNRKYGADKAVLHNNKGAALRSSGEEAFSEEFH
jgi:hypothetical protein